MSRKHGGLALAVVLLATACAINPVSRRPEFVVMSREKEALLGEREAARVAQEMGILPDEGIAAYVARVGARVAQHSRRTDVAYRFLVVDSEIVNAFALPGGYIYVTRGLLARLNREAELANVLGHEIGHVAARHAVQRVTAATPLAMAAGIPAAAVGLVLPGLGRSIGALGQLANALTLAPYSRAHELEADRLGQEMAAAAGWDPLGLADFLHTLTREEQLSGAEAGPSFLRTHPLTEDRVARGRDTATRLERSAELPIAATRAAFLEKLDGLLVGRSAAEGVFRDNAFLHPDLDLRMRFPEGWTTLNGRDFVAAQAPGGTARVVLQIAAEADDALAVARNFAQAEGAAFGLLPKAIQLGSREAVRAYGRSGDATLDVSWIAHGAYVFQITGICQSREYDAFQTPFIDVALSLRALSADERAEILEDRLRIVRAEAGETLPQLIERGAARWSAEQVAVANAIGLEARLEAGQLVKLPIAQRYAKSEPAETSALR